MSRNNSGRHGRAIDQPHSRGEGFAGDRVGHTKATGLGDARVALEHQIDFGWLNLEAGAVDLILDAAGQADAALCVHDAGIAGAVPAVLEHLLRSGRRARK